MGAVLSIVLMLGVGGAILATILTAAGDDVRRQDDWPEQPPLT